MKKNIRRSLNILLTPVLILVMILGVTKTVHAATSVSTEAELIAALAAGGEIELAGDIEMVGADRIIIANDATIDLKNNTLMFSTTTYNPLGVDAGKTLEFKGPGTVEFVSTFGSSIKGELVVSGGAELKLASVDLGSGALTVTGSGSKISSGFFNGSGSLTITENAAMECTGDRLSCKNIKISGGASVKAKTIYSNSRGGSVVITGTGTTVEGYDTNSVTIGGSNANSSSSISISSGATVNNANYIGHYGAVTIDGAAINGRENGCIVTGSPLTVKGSSGLNNVSSLQDSVTIADNSNVTFLNTSGETFKSIRKLTFTGTPTLYNMGKVSCNYTCEGIYLYQDAGAVFNLQDGLTGLDVSFGTGSEAMIYIKDQRSGLLPGIVRYDGDTLPRDIAVYEGTLQRDTADFTSYCQDEQVSTLESGTDKLRMAAPICKIERNGSTIEYYTVQEAFSDAKKGETIVMIRDAICGDSIVLDPQTSNGVTEYTLDLAGFGIGQESSLPYNNDHIPFVVYSGMTLNLTDSSDKQTGYISVYDYEYPLFFNAGTINIDRGTYFGVICGASFNGADMEEQAKYYQSIGSDGTYVFKEAYIIHAKDVQSKDEYDSNYSIDELSYITIAENYGIDEDFEPGYSPADLYVSTHIKKITYFVTFDANGGDGSMEKQEIDPNTPTALNANTFALTGSAFTGWNTEADGSGTAYADQAEVTLTDHLTLYAQWKPVVTVTFDANGGNGTMDAVDVIAGEEIALPKNTLTRDGYVFDGWNTKADGSGTAYEDEAKVKTDAGITLYAQWKEEQKKDPVVTVEPKAKEGLTETGDPQDLITPGSAEGGTMEYSSDGEKFSTEIPKGTEAGDYTVYYRVVGDEGYNDLEKKSITVTIGKAGTTEGKLTTETRQGEGAPKMDAEISKETAMALLTEDEKKVLEDGGQLHVYLQITALTDETVPAADKAALSGEITRLGGVKTEFFDLSMFKQINGGEPIAIHETEPITVTITVPDTLVNKDETVTRTFIVLRYHGEKVTEMARSASLQIPITTDRFSTYAITYSDTPVDETPEIPDTGDRTNVMPWILLEVVASAALAVLIVIKKRRES